MEYPTEIIGDYASGRILRREFVARLAAWQKARGIDYECKGVAGKGFVGLTYRGKNAVIRGGTISWVCDRWRDPKTGGWRYARGTAHSVIEFKRKIDIAMREPFCGR